MNTDELGKEGKLQEIITRITNINRSINSNAKENELNKPVVKLLEFIDIANSPPYVNAIIKYSLLY